MAFRRRKIVYLLTAYIDDIDGQPSYRGSVTVAINVIAAILVLALYVVIAGTSSLPLVT